MEKYFSYAFLMPSTQLITINTLKYLKLEKNIATVDRFFLISVPVKPKHSQMITLNTTTVTVWLDSWGDGGCGILYFVIEYREISQSQVNQIFVQDKELYRDSKINFKFLVIFSYKHSCCCCCLAAVFKPSFKKKDLLGWSRVFAALTIAMMLLKIWE